MLRSWSRGNFFRVGGAHHIKDPQKLVMVPPSLETFSMDANTARAGLPQHIHTDMAQYRKIFVGMSYPGRALHLREKRAPCTECAAVFTAPVESPGGGEGVDGRKAEQEGACCFGDRKREMPLRSHNPNAAQAFPLLFWVHIRQNCWGRRRPVLAHVPLDRDLAAPVEPTPMRG